MLDDDTTTLQLLEAKIATLEAQVAWLRNDIYPYGFPEPLTPAPEPAQ